MNDALNLFYYIKMSNWQEKIYVDYLQFISTNGKNTDNWNFADDFITKPNSLIMV